ncbi:hypothetical protein [Streptomyces sp. NBC_00354]|nr:hypothetical protein OG296_40755 [Streptomyces sp. NBC_01001]
MANERSELDHLLFELPVCFGELGDPLCESSVTDVVKPGER